MSEDWGGGGGQRGLEDTYSCRTRFCCQWTRIVQCQIHSTAFP